MTLSDREVAHAEVDEGEIDAFIERRARSSTVANERTALWRESERRYGQGTEHTRRSQRARHCVQLADVHQRLAQQNHELVERLRGEIGGA